MRIELLYFDGCPNHEALLPRLRAILDEAGVRDPVEQRRVETEAAAEADRFLGSPTVRVEGMDVDPGASGRSDFGLKCRIYRTANGLTGTPPEEWIRRAILEALR